MTSRLVIAHRSHQMRNPSYRSYAPAAIRLAGELLQAAGPAGGRLSSVAAANSMITAPVNPAFRDDDPPSDGACLWCGHPFRARRGGSPQRFCRARCRTAFWSALRRWGERAIAAGTLTVTDLRNGLRQRARCKESPF
jgi:hypothetical protein